MSEATRHDEAFRRLEQPIAIRPADSSSSEGPGDRGYVFQSWLRDYQHSPTVRGMDPRIYYLEQQRVIERLWESAAVIVACDPDEPRSILGWACGELWSLNGELTGSVVHYVYVRNNFRQRRIARRLLVDLVGQDALDGKIPLFYSHLPAPVNVQEIADGDRGGRRWTQKPSPALSMAKNPQYNPYLAFR